MRTEATIRLFATAALLALCGLAACRSDESRPQPARVTAERFAPRPAAIADEPPAADARPANQPALTTPPLRRERSPPPRSAPTRSPSARSSASRNSRPLYTSRPPPIPSCSNP